jgi:poly-gamma-glutamate capsule biosynthesis protein CapA/YwtB (metallophosphatase superfamily)
VTGDSRWRPTRRQVLAATLPAIGGCLSLRPPTAEPSAPAVTGDRIDARLGFLGDAMLGRSVDERWRDGDPAGIWGPLADRFRGLDGLFLNLECCLSTGGERWPDKTYYFRGDPDWAVPALEAAGTSWVSLANNHTLDFGATALRDTRSVLSAAGIAHAGAGPDRPSALAPSIVSAGPVDVAVLALTGRASEFRASGSEPGTAHLQPDAGNGETRRTVRRLLDLAAVSDPDLVVASLHWGPNWETSPSESQRRFARWLIDEGVDLVHGHSAHVVQGVELHRGRPILYDTGDVVDDYSVKPELHNDRSFLFVLDVADGRLQAVRLVPIRIEDEAVRPAGEDAAAWLREAMRRRCEPFDTPVRRNGSEAGLRIPIVANGNG